MFYDLISLVIFGLPFLPVESKMFPLFENRLYVYAQVYYIENT